MTHVERARVAIREHEGDTVRLPWAVEVSHVAHRGEDAAKRTERQVKYAMRAAVAIEAVW